MSRLSNSRMRSHLKTSHAKEWNEFQEKEKDQDVEKAASEQEHLEADETENAGVQLFNLNSHKKRKFFSSKTFLTWWSPCRLMTSMTLGPSSSTEQC